MTTPAVAVGVGVPGWRISNGNIAMTWPAGIADGDIVIAAYAMRIGFDSTITIGVTFPSGWSALPGSSAIFVNTASADHTDLQCGVYRHTYSTGDVAPTIAFAGGTIEAVVALSIYRHVQPAGLVGTASSTWSVPTTGHPAAPLLTATALVVSIGFSKSAHAPISSGDAHGFVVDGVAEHASVSKASATFSSNPTPQPAGIPVLPYWTISDTGANVSFGLASEAKPIGGNMRLGLGFGRRR